MLRVTIPKARHLARRLLRCRLGVSTLEFALILPIVMSIGLYGVEIVYLNTIDMKLSEVALSLADNASRLGQADNSAVTPTVTETDINEVMKGVEEQGAPIGFAQNGRIILSSLERDTETGKQYIHWQRCYGGLRRQSAYGNDTTRNGLNGDVITGMGSGATKVTATSASTAVMFVEVYYSYTGLVGQTFVANRVLRKEGAFLIRDERNLAPGVTGTGAQHSCA